MHNTVRPYIPVLLVFLLCPSLLVAQEMEHGGDNRPDVIIGSHYYGVSEAGTNTVTVEAALTPEFILPRKLMRIAKYTGGYQAIVYRGYILGGSYGKEFAKDGTEHTRWRATLADMDIGPSTFSWGRDCVFGSVPLVPVPPPSSYGYYWGFTLADYDRSGDVELDARWAQVRGGFRWTNYRSPFHATVTAGAGYSSIDPGDRNWGALDAAMEEAGSSDVAGLDAEGKARLGMTVNLGNGFRRATLTADGTVRNLIGSHDFYDLRLGGTFHVLWSFPKECPRDAGYIHPGVVPYTGHGFELMISYYRKFLGYEGWEQKRDILEAGLQYTFNL